MHDRDLCHSVRRKLIRAAAAVGDALLHFAAPSVYAARRGPMSNAKTGLWSAIGALLGGAATAAAVGYYYVELRPRVRGRGRRGGGESVEDAMTVGGAAGAVMGAFIGGMASGEPSPTLAPVYQIQKAP